MPVYTDAEIVTTLLSVIAVTWLIASKVTLWHYKAKQWTLVAAPAAQVAPAAPAPVPANDEKEELRAQVRFMEERLAVLERIATDPAERTAREIEQLRTA